MTNGIKTGFYQCANLSLTFNAYIRSIPKQLTKNSIYARLIYSLISNDVHYFHTLDKKSHFHFIWAFES